MDEFRQRFGFDNDIFVNDGDFALGHIHINGVAGFNLFYILANFQHGQTDIDGIAIENTCEAICYDAFDALNLQNNGSVLAGGAAAKVFASYDVVAHLNASGKVFYQVFLGVFHSMLCQLGEIGNI